MAALAQCTCHIAFVFRLTLIIELSGTSLCSVHNLETYIWRRVAIGDGQKAKLAGIAVNKHVIHNYVSFALIMQRETLRARNQLCIYIHVDTPTGNTQRYVELDKK